MVGAAAVLALTAGCTSILDRPSLPPAGTGNLRTGTAATTATSASITPVTPDGLVTGPGATHTGIVSRRCWPTSRPVPRLHQGARLSRQRSVNTTGGLCGRAVGLLDG